MKRIALSAVLVFLAGVIFAQTSNGLSEQSDAAPILAPTKAAASPAAKPAPAPRTAPAQAAPAQRAAPVIVQPIITNPPVVNNHYYGKVYNPPQAQSQAQTQAPTTIIIPIPVPMAPVTAQSQTQASPRPAPAVPAFTVPAAPASAALPRRDPNTGYIIPAGPPRRTIRGILGVERGMITLTDDNEVKWFIMGLERYIGLIEGLNIGEEAEVKGYAPNASSAAQERFFQPATLILEGAEYDIGPLSAASRPRALPLPFRKEAAPQVQAAQPVQTAPVQPGAVQTAGGFQYQPIIIQPAPPPREEKYVPWVHVHSSPWAPHYGAVAKDIDTSSFWNEKDDVWW